MSQEPSVFESFNAKNLKPEQVAKSFVPSKHFKNIARRRHSLIVGPRGSGKTTLLKMLQAEALDSWTQQDAEKYKSQIDFIGVFVPTDRVWKEQIDSLGKKTLDKEEKEEFSLAIFTTHVLYQLSVCFRYKAADLTDKAVSSLVEELGSSWGLTLKSLSFTSLISALASRKSEIPRIVKGVSRLSKEERAKILLDDKFSYIDLDLIQTINSGVEIFCAHNNGKLLNWAFLFDELELAPHCVVDKLIEALRGNNDRILFKLSIAPYSPSMSVVKDLTSAMPGNDHDVVLLWNSSKGVESKEFSYELLNSMLRERQFGKLRASEIFANPTLQLRDTLVIQAYDTDYSFRTYWNKKGINIEDVPSIKGIKRNEFIGKIAPILKIRNVVRKPYVDPKDKPSQIKIKSLPQAYAGIDSLFDILEGNPRWIIGVITPLLDEFEANGNKITPAKQLLEVKSAMDKFLLLLKTIPSPITQISGRAQGVDFAINIIGEYFNKRIILDDFTDTPRGTFKVDKDVDPSIKSSLGAALNAGALVDIPRNKSDVFLGDLTGQRFRLSYLLAPKFSMPLTLMAPISLTRILNQTEDKYELSLFD